MNENSALEYITFLVFPRYTFFPIAIIGKQKIKDQTIPGKNFVSGR